MKTILNLRQLVVVAIYIIHNLHKKNGGVLRFKKNPANEPMTNYVQNQLGSNTGTT